MRATLTGSCCASPQSKCIISRDTAILPRKLDWMLSDRLEDIKQIMNDNGTFINFPPIGSQASLISVYGDHRVNIERTIRSIMALVSWSVPREPTTKC